TCTIAGRLDKAPSTETLMRSLPPWRAAFLLITATALAATSVSETKAEDAGQRASVRLAQAATGDPNASRVPEQDQPRAEVLTRGFAAARRDIESVLTALRKAREESAQTKGALENADAELQSARQQEREQAGRLEQELATARRDLATQTALAGK